MKLKKSCDKILKTRENIKIFLHFFLILTNFENISTMFPKRTWWNIERSLKKLENNGEELKKFYLNFKNLQNFGKNLSKLKRKFEKIKKKTDKI